MINIIEGQPGRSHSIGEQSMSFQDITNEYKQEPTNPGLLNRFMSSFWQEAGKKIKKTIVVEQFPSTTKALEEERKKGYMPIFVPQEVNIKNLGKMFPELKPTMWEEIQFWQEPQNEKNITEIVKSTGWLWIESSINAPNRNINMSRLKEILSKQKAQGQSLRTYIIGSQISKVLKGEYFDQGMTQSRLLGTRVYFKRHNSSSTANASFYPKIGLGVVSGLNPQYAGDELGGRSERKIQAK